MIVSVATFFVILILFSFIPYIYHYGFNFQLTLIQAQTGDQHDYLIYENTTYGFKIQYPADWSKTESSNVHYAPSVVRVVSLRSPTELGPYGPVPPHFHLDVYTIRPVIRPLEA